MYKDVKLSLVGAGPGDPDLLTLKAWKAIQKADIILFDALVGQEVLNLIPESTPKIYVGKRCGKHSQTQEEINHLIVEMAQQYQCIVRLKGGDPFVFGRGQEEVDYAELFGIQTEVIPGISSAIGVPGSCGIPLTHRGLSESFWVITAHTKNQKISQDIILAAKSTATLVILMGTRKLTELIDCVKKYRLRDTPIALIQNGTLPNEKVIVGCLDDILMKAKTAGFASPGIIVIGEVVATHQKFRAGVLENLLSI